MLTQTESRLTNALQNLLHAARTGQLIPTHLLDAGEDALACNACHNGALPPPDGGPCCECGAASTPARHPVQTPDGWRCRSCGSVLDACGCAPF